MRWHPAPGMVVSRPMRRELSGIVRVVDSTARASRIAVVPSASAW